MTEQAAADYRIRRVRADDWQGLRDLRLEMLEDTPKAFLETLEQARRRADREWRTRALRDEQDPRVARFVAEAPDGALLGVMGCHLERPGRTVLVGVYVTPAWRGTGLAEELLATTERWARDTLGGGELYLLVHEDNDRAQAFYRRLGFVATGATMPYELDPRELEIEMVRPMADPAPGSP